MSRGKAAPITARLLIVLREGEAPEIEVSGGWTPALLERMMHKVFKVNRAQRNKAYREAHKGDEVNTNDNDETAKESSDEES